MRIVPVVIMMMMLLFIRRPTARSCRELQQHKGGRSPQLQFQVKRIDAAAFTLQHRSMSEKNKREMKRSTSEHL